MPGERIGGEDIELDALLEENVNFEGVNLSSERVLKSSLRLCAEQDKEYLKLFGVHGVVAELGFGHIIAIPLFIGNDVIIND